MKILITGCAGFIGFHLCKKILEVQKKTKILGIDNLTNISDGLNNLINWTKANIHLFK